MRDLDAGGRAPDARAHGDQRRRDQYLLTADFDDYWRVQRAIDAAWRDPRGWWAKAIRNTARMAWFSSDRAMRVYAEEIWRVRLG